MLVCFRRRAASATAPAPRTSARPIAAVLTGLVLTLVQGCIHPAPLNPDGGQRDAGPPPLVLTAVTLGPLGLPFGSTATLEVRLTDLDGLPRALETIDFALEGSAADSSLSELTSVTDTDGIATIGLSAGDRPASFRLRANHPLASPIYLDVTVAASFGRLLVHPTYAGPRTIETWTVTLQRDGDCALALAMPDMGSLRVVGDPVGEARFDALATDVPYIVVVRAMGNDQVVATGCVMGVGILADTQTVLDVPALSTPLTISGAYEVQVTLDAAAATLAPLEAYVSDATSRTGGELADADRLLDALETTLTGNAVGLGALTRLRGAGADGALASALGSDASAPSSAAAALLARAIAALVDLRTEATLEVGSGDVPTLTFRRLVADGRGSVPLPLSLTAVPDTVFAATFHPELDTLSVDRLAIPLPLGEVLVAVIEAQRLASGFTTTGELFGTDACVTLGTFVEGDAVLATACDATCRAAACSTALDATLGVLLEESATLDAARAQLELSGTLEIRDGDSDLGADTLNGELSGTYDSADGMDGGAVTGTLSAARPLG